MKKTTKQAPNPNVETKKPRIRTKVRAGFLGTNLAAK